MTNYEHLVSTSALSEFLDKLTYLTEFEIRGEYHIKMAREPISFPEEVAKWLEEEYEPPTLYVKVDDLIQELSKSDRTILDHTCSMNSGSVSYVTVDQILSNLHLYTKDTIENECSSK